VGVGNDCSGQVLRGAEPERGRAFGGLSAWLLALLAALAQAQSPVGSLSGTVTDLYSRPVGGASLVLRNAATGARSTATTGKNGAYRFTGLMPGEYTLEADSPRLGEGQIAGIFVSSGHEARVQAAVDFEPRPAMESPAATRVANPSDQVAHGSEPSRIASATPRPLSPFSQKQGPSAGTVSIEARLSLEPVTTLPLTRSEPIPSRAPARRNPPPAPAPPGPQAPSVQLRSVAPAAPLPPEKPSIQASIGPSPRGSAAPSIKPPELAGAAEAIAGVPAALQANHGVQKTSGVLPPSIAPDPQASVLDARQLQSLPLSGRHWENFVLDGPSTDSEVDASDKAPVTTARPNPTAITVDSASIRLAFGGRAGGRMRSSSLMGPAASESAILQVRKDEKSGELSDHNYGGRASVVTQSGGDHLHGQAFLFDRRNLWGAQNPFTQWVKPAAPGTSTTTPAFTAFPYTAQDHEDRWGVGMGSVLKRRKLFWFAAYDGSHRNDPGVATVRHPENFFAQPANDEMQVLSARLGLSSVDPVAEGLAAYSGLLESLDGLLGPAARTANQGVGFGRLDWQAAERHHFTLEGTVSRWNSPGGGLTRTSEPYGSHSFGSSRANEVWLLGRWEAFLTPNLLAVTQGSVGHHILTEAPASPSPFEQTLNVNAWGQLPQMVVDSRYGFTMGNPARFGTGSYPDEHLYEFQQALDWVRGSVMVKAGGEWRHNADATTMVRNHIGTYHYSRVENFISDALAFQKYGLSDALDPRDQHNCDQRGKAWRDTNNQLHGLGYLPCYTYYSQIMGPTDWHLSTNDLAGFATVQWQPAKRFVLSAALRWEREYLPPPIPLVNNPALPLTQKIPSPGNEWGPRVSFAWGSGKNHGPVFRAGYGMYFGRTQNSVLETALTQTGSVKGDLNFFMRPTDNLVTGGAPPFPYVLAGTPSTVVKPGAVELAPGFRNPEIHQGEASIEENLPGHMEVAAAAVVSLARRLPVTVDTNFDPANNPGTITYGVTDGLNAGPIKARQITVPFFASWPSEGSPTLTAGRLDPSYQQISELVSRANSTYEAAMLRVSHSTRRGLSFHARYTYAHAMDWNPNESMLISGSSMLDPRDFRQEYGTSNLDIRHSLSSMLIWEAPWKRKGLEGRFANGWMLSGIGQFHSGLPYTMRTAGSIPEEFTTSGAAIVGLGPGMNGYGGDNRVYGVGRNTYRYPYTWKADARLGKKFDFGEQRELELLAESFNLFNHQNVTQLETVGYYISPGSATGSLPTLNFLTGLKTGQTEFGKPLDVNATDFYRPRQFDFGLRMRF
jgi:hypothetical protein